MPPVDLPDDLVPMVTGVPHINVFGPTKPWAPPPDWLDETRRRLMAIATRPGLTDVKADATLYPDGVPFTVSEARMLSETMLGAATEKSGTLQNIGAHFVADHRLQRPETFYNGTLMNTWVPGIPGAAFNESDKPQRRGMLIEYYRDLLAVLTEFPPFAVRARALAAVFDRLVADPAVLELHRRGPLKNLPDLWRSTLLRESDLGSLPDYFGPTEYLAWTVSGLRVVHARLLATAGPEGGELTDLIASVLLALNRPTVPGGLAATDIGVDGVEAVRRAMSALRAGFDRQVWRARLTDWLERAILVGEAETARVWVGLHFSCCTALCGWPLLPKLPTAPPVAGADLALGSQYITALKALWTPRPTVVNPIVGQLSTVEEPLPLPLPVAAGGQAGDDVDLAAELDGLVGLAPIKQRVARINAEAVIEQLRRDTGLPAVRTRRHMVFAGNPGTAKTTIARLIGRIYAARGVLASGAVTEVSRAELFNSLKVTGAVADAAGGVLVINIGRESATTEASREAVATLIRAMDDRTDLVVVAAGHPREVAEFLAIQPGLASRFPTPLNFVDYSD
ncbi:MAG TPA: hypothetical protein VHF06_31615, partial [Pseudonocardiaceae bacterium]|nr:hypothetical protein [Pseudonocardiaceae bacterium]